MDDSPLFIRLAGLSIKQAAIIALILVGLFYLTLYNDGTEIETRIAANEVLLVQERNKAEETRKLLADLESLRAQVQNMGENLRITLSKLPTELTSFRLVRDIQRIARAAGADIKSIKPKSPRAQSFYEELPVEVLLEGEYKDLVTFLYYVSGLERITRVRDFSIFTRVKGEDRGDQPRLSMNVEVVSFRYIPGAEQPQDEANKHTEGEL